MRLEMDQVGPGVYQARTKYVAWALVEEAGEVTLVDTGWPGDRERVLRSLEEIGRRGSDVSAIVLTHGHRDHQGNAAWLHQQYGVPVRAHAAEEANALGTRIEEVSIPTLLRMAWRPDVLVWGLDVIRLGALTIHRVDSVDPFTDGLLAVPGKPVCVHTPGHTSGHAALHLPDRGVLLVGDALMTQHPVGTGAQGVQLLPDYFNVDTQLGAESLERLRPLAADVVVPGHGPAFLGTPDQAVDQALSNWSQG